MKRIFSFFLILAVFVVVFASCAVSYSVRVINTCPDGSVDSTAIYIKSSARKVP